MTQTDAAAAAAEEFQCLHEIVKRAHQRLDKLSWDYIVGGGETEASVRRNRYALEALAFLPRVLRDVSKVDATVERFGRRLRLPVVIAPVGGLDVLDPGGAATVARAAGEFGVAHMLSSSCPPGLEEVAKAAPEALRIYQLYVRGDDAWVEDHVSRAIANGYTAFCLTVDVPVISRRERDIANRYPLPSRRMVTGEDYQAALSWRTVERIKSKFQIPLIVKGIATVADAKIAVEHGVDWIYISNHGGRQLDYGRGTMAMVPGIVEALAGRAKTIVDGSFYRGTDILKAVAAGVDLVGIGRMQCFGLGAAGQAGVYRMLELLEDEILRDLAFVGVNTFGELDPSYLCEAPVTNDTDMLSGFPLLDIAAYPHKS